MNASTPRDRMKELVTQTKNLLARHWATFSSREIGLLALLGGAAVIIGLFLMVEAISESFSAQSREMAQLEQTIKSLPSRIDTFGKLLSKRDAIEQHYKSVEIKEGVRSYLENVVKAKAQATVPPVISDGPGGSFGKDYEQTSYKVSFTTASLAGLVETVKELSFGKSPLIVGRLKIDMSPRNDALKVELDVSSIRLKNS